MEIFLTVLLLGMPFLYFFFRWLVTPAGAEYRGKRYLYYGRKVTNGVSAYGLKHNGISTKVYLYGAYEAQYVGTDPFNPDSFQFRCGAFNARNNPDDTINFGISSLSSFVSFQREVGQEGDLR